LFRKYATDRHTHSPLQTAALLKNIWKEEFSEFQITDAAEIPNWRGLTPHKDGRVSLKE